MPDESTPRFSDRLLAAIGAVGVPACVGLDPVLEQIPHAVRAAHPDPPAATYAFCLGVIDAVAGIVPAVKPQSACFERLGPPGTLVLHEVCAHASRRGLAVVLDAKRGDIGVSARHYARAAVQIGAHAITVNAYLGMETVVPYLDAGLGAFVLVRTSNPDSDAVQRARLADGRTVAEMMADHVAVLGAGHLGTAGVSDAGAVVGATKAADGPALRKRMPNTMFLVPGYGAQGGSAEDVRELFDSRGGGVLVNASRSVLYPTPPEDPDWRHAVALAAQRFTDDLRRVC
ncbi:MAG: orotidine-5'-phosphate decarboxylase [Phycisphaerales bacterium]|nr:orotidine-5'-phosphate decarboxylase [Phycisphaerales bacterium]